ncbi:sulfurtransferase complex subunit TusC [Buchnera aphidicola]|uniref:sulfurtransferase complex subunit TusC n=1 Tax=Buchnera aphidicola TaxID=9 RepID=UPI0034647663
MKKIAIIFSHAPYGKHIGKDGLNFVLSASCYTNNLKIFFIGDGIFQIIDNQNSRLKFFKSYCASFKILSLYDVNEFYICYESLLQRGFEKDISIILNAKIIDAIVLRKKINQCNHIINF